MRGASISHSSNTVMPPPPAATPLHIAKLLMLAQVLWLQQQLRNQHVKFSAFIRLHAREQHLSRQTPVGLEHTHTHLHTFPMKIIETLL